MPVLRPLQRPQLWSTSGYVCKSCQHKLLVARSQFSRSQANLSPAEGEGAGGDDWFSNFNDLSIERQDPKQSSLSLGRIISTGRGDGEQSEKEVPVSRAIEDLIPGENPYIVRKLTSHERRHLGDRGEEPQTNSRKSRGDLSLRPAQERSARNSGEDTRRGRARSRRKERASLQAAQAAAGDQTTDANVLVPENAETRRQFEATLEGLSKTINDMLNKLWSGEKKTAPDTSAEKKAGSDARSSNSVANRVETVSLSSDKVEPKSTTEDDDSLPWYLRARIPKSSSPSQREPGKARTREPAETSPWGVSARTNEPPRPFEAELPPSSSDELGEYTPFMPNRVNKHWPPSEAQPAKSIAEELAQIIPWGLETRVDESSPPSPQAPSEPVRITKVSDALPWGLQAREKPPEEPKPVFEAKVPEAPWGLEARTDNPVSTTEETPSSEGAVNKLAEPLPWSLAARLGVLSSPSEKAPRLRSSIREWILPKPTKLANARPGLPGTRHAKSEVEQSRQPSTSLADLKSNLSAELGAESSVEAESQRSASLANLEDEPTAQLGEESGVEVKSAPSTPLAQLENDLSAELSKEGSLEASNQPSSPLAHVETPVTIDSGEESSVQASSQLSSSLALLGKYLTAELGTKSSHEVSTVSSDEPLPAVLSSNENRVVALEPASELREDGDEDVEKFSGAAVEGPSTTSDKADSVPADVHSSTAATQDPPDSEVPESAIAVGETEPAEKKAIRIVNSEDLPSERVSKINDDIAKLRQSNLPEAQASGEDDDVPERNVLFTRFDEEVFKIGDSNALLRKYPSNSNPQMVHSTDYVDALLKAARVEDRPSTNSKVPPKKFAAGQLRGESDGVEIAKTPLKKHTSDTRRGEKADIVENADAPVTKTSAFAKIDKALLAVETTAALWRKDSSRSKHEKDLYEVKPTNDHPEEKPAGEDEVSVENARPPQKKRADEIKVSEPWIPRRGIATMARSQSLAASKTSSKNCDDNGHMSFRYVKNFVQASNENTRNTSSQAALAQNVQQTTTPNVPSNMSNSDTANVSTITPAKLVVKPLNIPQRPVPSLEYGLDRVLFNPGIYQLQDPHSRVYNFDPYLQKIMPVVEFDFNALKEYKTSSQDKILSTLASKHGKRYIGSTSSMTGMLGHFHYLLSNWRPLNLDMFSKGFSEKNDAFTLLNRAPNAIFLRWKNGTYAIDADKQYDSGNVLMLLGKSMEKLLTMPTSEYERYRKSDPRTVSEEDRTAPETFEYTTMGDFLMRSQLDAHDPRLPGTGMFDLKTRAVLTVRMNAENFEPMTGYEIQSLQGRFRSYEREFYDMIRSTMLKYSLQARMGRMDGIFVAYHNVERIFGFQYLPIEEMDRAIHGQSDRCLGDQEFKTSLELMNQVLNKATAKFPEQSLRFHFETTTETLEADGLTTVMWIFAEPMSDAEIDAVQETSKTKVAEFERTMMGVQRRSEGNDAKQIEDVEKAPTSQDLNTSDSAADTEFLESIASSNSIANKPLFAASLIAKSHVNGEPVARPENLKAGDVWEVAYTLREWDESSNMWTRYAQMKARRRELFMRNRTGEESPDDSENGNGNGELTNRQKRERAYIDFLKSMSQSGRDFRRKIDRVEAGKEPVIVGQDVRPSNSVVEEKVEDVDGYMAWLYGKE